MSGMNHDCSKRYCHTCKQITATGHLCFMRQMKDVLPANAKNVLYISYDFETTHKKTYSDTAKEHAPNHVCVQQFCATCEEIQDCSIDCDRCGRRRQSFWNDPVGDLLSYLCETSPSASKIVAIVTMPKYSICIYSK